MKINDYVKTLVCLYVEDDEYVREPFSILLKRYFKKVIVATNGKEGLEKFKENKVDIILSDIRMPVMDGIEMVKKIREIDKEVIIFFITAFNDIEYLQMAIELDIDAYITKPVDKNILIEKLNKFANILKTKKENEYYYKLINLIFNKIKTPMLIIKEDEILFKNQAFKYYFDNLSLDDLKNKIKNNSLEIEKNGIVLTFEVEEESLEDNIFILLFKDITRYINEIFIDSLTSLFNRKVLEVKLPFIFNKKLCFIIGDIDNFKKINDTFGHNVGDEVLKKIGEIIKNSVRKDDLAIRWGGEEFLIIIECNDLNIGVKKAEEIRKKIESVNFERIGNVTMSFGVTTGYVNSLEDITKNVEKADKALYEAKNKGKNRVELYQ